MCSYVCIASYIPRPTCCFCGVGEKQRATLRITAGLDMRLNWIIISYGTGYIIIAWLVVVGYHAPKTG